jgi:hypothetical protein
MTVQQFIKSENFKRYHTTTATTTQELLELMLEKNIMDISPLKELSASLCVANLAVMAPLGHGNDEEVKTAFAVGLATVAEKANVDLAQVRQDDDSVMHIIDDLAGRALTEEPEVAAMTLLHMSCFAALAAAIAYHGGFDEVTDKQTSGFLDVIDGLNTSIVHVIERINEAKDK